MKTKFKIKNSFVLFSFLIPFLFLSIIPNSISSNTINSITSSQTPIPIEYRTIIYLLIAVILIFLALKFFGLFAKILIIILLAYLVITILIGLAKTGTLTLQYSFYYVSKILNFISISSKRIHTISNVSNTITSTTNSLS